MTSNSKVLVVEDDSKLARLVQEYLEKEGLTVSIESRGDQAVERILHESPDCVILDIMLPGLDGLEVCKRLRPEYTGPILMLTARRDEVDEVVGLELGADDYLAKPVRPRVLLARIRALLRRASENADQATRNGGSAIVVGDLVINPANRTVTLGRGHVDLTTSEFDLLRYLAERAGRVVMRQELFEHLKGIPYDGMDRSIDLTVTRLRKKLGDDAKPPRLIKSVRGSGYLMARDP